MLNSLQYDFTAIAVKVVINRVKSENKSRDKLI